MHGTAEAQGLKAVHAVPSEFELEIDVDALVQPPKERKVRPFDPLVQCVDSGVSVSAAVTAMLIISLVSAAPSSSQQQRSGDGGGH